MESNVITYGELDSTNREAATLISSGLITGDTFVVADYQGNGRGQGNNHWVSDRGMNLLMSWIVFPAFLSVKFQFQLSKAVSLAISDLLESHTIPCKIKWPNDILINSMKAGGILIENSIMENTLKHSIIGIGLNINQRNFPRFPYQASSMCKETGKTYDLTEVRTMLMTCLRVRFEQLKNGKTKDIDREYGARMFGLNEESKFSDGTAEFIGIIRGVNEIGELQVETVKGMQTFGFHEITLIY
ncbi:MAG: biotin--[acetyl-CoA-carboxylase] ligase [Bacteroidales bacterium]